MTENKELSAQAARALDKWQALKRRYGHEMALPVEETLPVLPESSAIEVVEIVDDVPLLTEVVDAEASAVYAVTAEQLAMLVQTEVQRVLHEQPQWVYEAWLAALHQRVQEQGLAPPVDEE